MRRAAHVELGPMSECEVREAFQETIVKTAGFALSEDAENKLVAYSKGHPYIIQLQGFYLMDYKTQAKGRAKTKIDLEAVENTWPNALETYSSRALEPLVEEMPAAQVTFLQAMASVLNEDRIAAVADIAEKLQRSANALSSTRAALINSGIIISPERGKLAFMIPYLADFVQQHLAESGSIAATVTAWKM
jgi:hypothetical protein